MVPRLRAVTPWQDNSEWEEVQRLVLSSDQPGDKRRALDMISVWRSRVSRLPAGVETTSALLQASLSGGLPSQLKLTLAAALNRFLNHLSHIGMNLFGVSKYHEVAERLGVPDWLVEVRHETTHGQMPGLEVLEAGLGFSLAWLNAHYWEKGRGGLGEGEKAGKRDEDYVCLHKLLECYMYLKLYQVWGTEKVGDIKDQEEMYDHLLEMWEGFLSVKKGKQKGGILLGGMSFKEAVGIVKNELHKYLGDNEAVILMAEVLVKEELLIPSTEFLHSVQGDGEVVGNGVPKELQLVWGDLIRCVDDKAGLICLFDKLVEICKGDQSGKNLDMAVAWIKVLTSSYNGNNKVLVLNQRERSDVGTSQLEVWIDHPNVLTMEYLEDLMDIVQPEVNGRMRRMVESLVKMAVGGETGRGEKIENVYTEGDLTEEDVMEVDDVPTTGWVLDTKHTWDSVSMGGWGKQTWEHLWLPEDTVWEDAVEEKEKVPSFTIGSVDWTPRKRENSNHQPVNPAPTAVPAFYRNEENQTSFGQQRKRYRRS